MKILDGKILAHSIQDSLIADLKEVKDVAGLAVILIGDHAPSHTYVKIKEKAAKEIGLPFKRITYPKNVTQDEIIDRIEKLNKNKKISGIIVQLPLPDHLDPDEIISHIHPHKDVDGFHHDNLIGLKEGKAFHVSPVALGMMALLEETGEKLKGRNAVILVNSELFAIPISYLLRQKGVDTTILISSYKTDLSYLTESDIIVIAIGHANFLKKEMIKKGAILIDVGINRLSDDSIVGDIDFEDVKEKASFATPVPGGVGPMTVAMLLSNTISSAKKSRYTKK